MGPGGRDQDCRQSRPSPSLLLLPQEVYATLVPVVVGIIIASGAEPSFHLFGFLTAISATALRAFKSGELWAREARTAG